MTEKRFTVYGKEIVQDNECWAVAYSEYNADVIATALNELNDENQELQGKYDAQKQLFCQLNSDKNNIWQDYQDLKKENEQLKSLLKEVEHELTSLTGLSAYDKCVSQIGYDEVFNDDRIDLDYSELLKKIEVNLND